MFSDDPVPVRFSNDTSPPGEQGFQCDVRYALYSVAGGPITVDIQSGLFAMYRDKPDTRYVLSNTNKLEIVKGTLPLDAPANHPLEFKVPHAGLYYLDVNDSGAAWNIRIPTDRPEGMVLSREEKLRLHNGMADIYFYVPKGTKQISYYWRGGPHTIASVDGKFEKTVDVDCEFVNITVPESQEGKVWRLSGRRLRHLLFFNLPNLISMSPGVLLIPREVARADGLNIWTGHGVNDK